MKKIFITFLLLFTVGALYAETGYLGIQWDDDIDKVKKIIEPLEKETTQRQNEVFENSILIMERVILGEKTKQFLFFDPQYKYLSFIGYLLPLEKTEKLIEKLDRPSEVININQMSKEAYQEIVRETDKSMDIDIALPTLIYISSLVAFKLKDNGYGKLKPQEKTEAKIHIYDYNEDTNIYILENLLEGLTVVIYLPGIQDF